MQYRKQPISRSPDSYGRLAGCDYNKFRSLIVFRDFVLLLRLMATAIIFVFCDPPITIIIIISIIIIIKNDNYI